MNDRITRSSWRRSTWTAGVLAGTLFSTHAAQACATCFGASDDKMAQGMNMGIVALLGVVVCVLGTILTAGIVIARRAHHLALQEAAVEPHAEPSP
jgi:hypothetical protein